MKKKIICIILTATLALSACTKDNGGSDPAPQPTAASTTDNGNQNGEVSGTVTAVQAKLPKDIYAQISSSFTLPELYQGDDDWILNNYGLDASKLEDYVCAEGDELHADRIFIIKTKDSADVADVVSKLNAVYGQLSSPEMLDYMPEQADTIKAGRVVSSGNYAYLLISPDADGIEAIIKEGIAAN